VASPLDWLQSLLGGGDPEATGQAAASTAMAPNVLQYAQDVLSGKIAAGGALAQNNYDPSQSPAQNALNPAGIAQATDVAMGVGPGAIRAFHGSPHSFDRFDISKIGTGEGAQAYGHGLYFAENEGVARGYRDAVTQKLGVGMGPANEWLARSGGDPHKALAMFEEFASGLPPTRAQAEIRAALETATKPGHMYEVDINADPKAFLDWDKPLSAQGEPVKSKLRDLGVGAGKLSDLGTPQEISATLDKVGVPGIRYLDQGSRVDPAAIQRQIDLHRGNLAAGSAMDAAERQRWETRIAELQTELTKPQTSNYAVFNDSLIQILRKYGLLPPVAGAGLMGMGGDNQ
jgi:hypothetical protein